MNLDHVPDIYFPKLHRKYAHGLFFVTSDVIDDLRGILPLSTILRMSIN